MNDSAPLSTPRPSVFKLSRLSRVERKSSTWARAASVSHTILLLRETTTDTLSLAGKQLPASQQKKTKAKKEDLDEDDIEKKKMELAS